MAEDIVAKVKLEGGSDVAQQLENIGEKGAEAFTTLAESITRSIGPIGYLSIGLGAFGTALLEMVHHTAEVGHQLETFAAQAGTSVEEVSALENAVASLGGGLENTSQMFRRLGTTITRHYEELKKDVDEAADKQLSAQLKVEKAEQSQFKARQEYAKAYYGAGPSAYEQQQEKQAEAATRLKEADEEVHLAKKKQDEERRNSAEAYTKAVHDIITGQKDFKTASIEANLSVDNVIKGLIGNTEGAEEAIKQYNGSLASMVGKGPEVKQVLYGLADYMKNAGNAAHEQAVMMQLLGRYAGTEMLLPLKAGSKGLEEQEERFKKLHLVVEEVPESLNATHKAFATLSTVLSTTGTQIGMQFAPVFTKGLEGITKWFEENHDTVLKWASTVSSAFQTVSAAVLDFGSAIAYIGGGIAKVITTVLSPLGPLVKSIGAVFKASGIIGGDAPDLEAGIGALLAGPVLYKLGGVAMKIGKAVGGKFKGAFAEECAAAAVACEAAPGLLGKGGKSLGVAETVGEGALGARLIKGGAPTAARVAVGAEAGAVSAEAGAVAGLVGGTILPRLLPSLLSLPGLALLAGSVGLAMAPQLMDMAKEHAIQGRVDEEVKKGVPKAEAEWRAKSDFTRAEQEADRKRDERIAEQKKKGFFGYWYDQVADVFKGEPPKPPPATGYLSDLLSRQPPKEEARITEREIPTRDAGTDVVAKQAAAASSSDKLASSLDSAASSADNLASAMGNAADKASQQSSGEGKASGGYLHGPGSETSDSIPIMASRGEYVVNASSVRRYGVGFMNSINSGFLRGGGFVGSLQGYAGGGAVTGRAAMSGGQSLHALDIRTNAGTFRATVTPDTMEAIQNSALASKLSATGERPSWWS